MCVMFNDTALAILKEQHHQYMLELGQELHPWSHFILHIQTIFNTFALAYIYNALF